MYFDNIKVRIIQIIFYLTAKGKALTDYKGQPNPGGGRTPLHFKKDDTIEITDINDPGWHKVLQKLIFISELEPQQQFCQPSLQISLYMYIL